MKYARLYGWRDAIYGEIFGLNNDLEVWTGSNDPNLHLMDTLSFIKRIKFELFYCWLSWSWWRSLPKRAHILRLERQIGLAPERPFVIFGA